MIKPVKGRIQVSDILDRIEELEDELEVIDEECADLSTDAREQEIYNWNEENKDEYDELIDLRTAASDSPAWKRHGELIDSFWLQNIIKDEYDDYVRDIVEDMPYCIKDNISVDWEGVADDIERDGYFRVEFDGNIYLAEV